VAPTMRAVRWHGRRDVRIDEVPEPPPPAAGQVRVRVAYCGICGSDVHEYLHGPVTIPVEPHPVTGCRSPVILGHEVSAWVDDVGDQVEGLRAGDLVALNALLPCGSCRECTRGDEHLCRQLGHIGMSADGGLAPLITVPAAMVVPAPPGVDPDTAALAEPFAVAVHALRIASAFLHGPCVVLGAGTIGLCVALLLRDAGRPVTMLDVAPERLRHAQSLGLRAVGVNDAAVLHSTAAAVFECSGSGAAVARASAYAAPAGAVVLLGLPEQPVPLDVVDVVLREIRVLGSMSHLAKADMAPALDFIAGNPRLARRLITATVPLEQAVDQGIEVLTGSRHAEHAKILVKVH
jgi:(R,R)-butanediol dehydrogenase / meso-butanediol dehydrogenase / diacetyl reductase